MRLASASASRLAISIVMVVKLHLGHDKQKRPLGFRFLTRCGVAASFASLQHGVVYTTVALTFFVYCLAFACSLSQPVLALLLEAACVHAFCLFTFGIMLRWGSPTGRRPSCASAAFVVLFGLQLSP